MDPNETIEIVYPNNNNNSNNNNNNNNNKRYKNQNGWEETEERETACRRRVFKFFFFLLFFLRSMKIGLQVLVETEGKVDLRDESYAWTPKSWTFVKLHEVGNFPTCVISSLKAI